VTNFAKKIERPFSVHVKSTCNFVAQYRHSVTKSISVQISQTLHSSIDDKLFAHIKDRSEVLLYRELQENVQSTQNRGITPCTIGSGGIAGNLLG
jgi:hypothetical protein